MNYYKNYISKKLIETDVYLFTFFILFELLGFVHQQSLPQIFLSFAVPVKFAPNQNVFLFMPFAKK